MEGNEDVNASKGTLIVVMVVFACLLGGLFIAFYYSPSKFFADSRHEGISLVKDNQEMGVYYNRTSYYSARDVPYRHNRIEYPPLGVLYLTIPAFFSRSFLGYENGLVIQNSIFALILVVVSYQLLRTFKRSGWWLCLLALPSFLFFTINRFDIFSTVLVQLSLLLLLKRKFTWSFVILSLAFLAKGYALVLFPVFFVYWLNQTGFSGVNLFKNKYALIMALPTVIVTAVICLLAGLENGLFPYIFQSTRHFNYGALPTIYLEALRTTLPAWLWSGGVTLVGYVLLLLQYILPMLIYAGYSLFRRFIKTKEDLVRWSSFVILLYILFSPYYSPQWFVWLLPLFILVFRGDLKMVGLIVFYDLLNYLQFPVVYNYLGFVSVPFNIVVLVRTMLLVVFLLLVAGKILGKYKKTGQPMTAGG